MTRATCQDFINVVDRYLLRELTPSEQAMLEQHHHDCSLCADYLKTYVDTVRIAAISGASRRADSNDCGAPDELVQSILEKCAKSLE